jgi:hypothetical protein
MIMRYCSHEDVGTLLALNFSADSKPSASKVLDIAGWISSEINFVLKSCKVEIPAEGTDLYNLLRMKSAQGSAGIIGLSYYGNSDTVQSGQGAYYSEQYGLFIKEVKENPALFRDMNNEAYIGNQFTNGSMTEDDLFGIMLDDEMAP